MKSGVAVYVWGVASFLVLNGAGATVVQVVLAVLWPIIPIAAPLLRWWKA